MISLSLPSFRMLPLRSLLLFVYGSPASDSVVPLIIHNLRVPSHGNETHIQSGTGGLPRTDQHTITYPIPLPLEHSVRFPACPSCHWIISIQMKQHKGGMSFQRYQRDQQTGSIVSGYSPSEAGPCAQHEREEAGAKSCGRHVKHANKYRKGGCDVLTAPLTAKATPPTAFHSR